MDVRIVGEPLPPPLLGGRALLVGPQRGRVVEAPRPVSGSSMVFELSLDVVVTPSGMDLRGPWVQGRRGDRFLYLCWGHAGPDAGDFDGFRRAKLMLGVLDPAEMLDAADDDVLVGRLSLVDARGGPVCAAVRPPAIRWSLQPRTVEGPDPTPATG
jgi:hypothetical protein